MLATLGLILVGLVGLGWAGLAARMTRLARSPAYESLGPTYLAPRMNPAPSVTAIVPARNEADHVAATVAALRRQVYPDLTITLIDDESTDETLAIVRQLAAESPPGLAPLEVVAGRTRPEGWVGKTWAVHQGTRAVTSEWLWFVDADMGLDPRALSTAIVEADQTGADLVSFFPGVRCETFWQTTIAASFMHIIAHLFPFDRANDPNRADAVAAGGFLLVRRSVYEAAGGHAAVRNSIVEDIDVARLVKRMGGRLAIKVAPRLAWTHMYGSFGQIWVGLRKNAYAGMEYMPHKFVVGAMIALTMAWAPLVGLVVGIWSRSPLGVALGLLGILAQVAATIPNLLFIGASLAYGFMLPLGISTYVAIATSSAWHYHRGRVLWKDRSITAATVFGPVVEKPPLPLSEEKRGQVQHERR